MDDKKPLLMHGVEGRAHRENSHRQSRNHGREYDKTNQDTSAKAMNERNSQRQDIRARDSHNGGNDKLCGSLLADTASLLTNIQLPDATMKIGETTH